jgi:hypothetical protein
MKKITKEIFIERASQIHNNEYDYSLVNYDGNDVKVKIICAMHGIFEQTPHSHLAGTGCKKCHYNKLSNLLKKSNEDFITEANIVHNNKYDYSKYKYINSNIDGCIICHRLDKNEIEHGEFWQNANKHLIKHGCPKCARERNDEANDRRNKKCKENFIEIANKVHNNRFIYLDEYVGSFKKMKIQCKECKTIFYQTPANHKFGAGCPNCKRSKSEKYIEDILKNRNINYISEYTFNDCKGKKRLLPFDFYLPEKNIIIEYQGEQHYKPVYFNGCKDEKKVIEGYESIKRTDKIKKEYCANNNIKLIEISYKDHNNINNIMEDILCQY